jgi:hypothetical protein
MIYISVFNFALIPDDLRLDNMVIKISLVFSLPHLGFGLRSIYISFSIQSGMACVRVVCIL